MSSLQELHMRAAHKFRWREGTVERADEHFEIRFGSAQDQEYDEWLPVARVGRGESREFLVQFLVEGQEYARQLEAVRRDLDFFLVDKNERDPWGYAQYHCGTSANVYSTVHWSYFRGEGGDRGRSWRPRQQETFTVTRREKELYRLRSPRSAYRDYQWPKREGIHGRGEFPVAVVRKAYHERGYDAWVSAQSKHGLPSYLLERLPGFRRRRDAAYLTTVLVFGEERLDAFHALAAEARLRHGLKSAGGDPDLFVQSRRDPRDRFFVEVKLDDRTCSPPFRDTLNAQQLVLFPLIESHLECHVRVATVCVQEDGHEPVRRSAVG